MIAQKDLCARQCSMHRRLIAITGIAALRETHPYEFATMVDNEYTFFWCGRQENERRGSVVRFAIKNSIANCLEQDPGPISDRFLTIKLPL